MMNKLYFKTQNYCIGEFYSYSFLKPINSKCLVKIQFIYPISRSIGRVNIMKRLECVFLILFKYVTKLWKKREETTRVKNVEKVQTQKNRSHRDHLIYIRYNLNTVYIKITL